MRKKEKKMLVNQRSKEVLLERPKIAFFRGCFQKTEGESGREGEREGVA